MNDLQIFKNKEFGNIRIIEKDGEPWFVGKDIAEALGYQNTRDALNKHTDSGDKADVAIHDGSQNRNMTIINESGLYSLVLSSKLPSAKQFKRWVTSEVLPAIRKTGSYTAPKAKPKRPALGSINVAVKNIMTVYNAAGVDPRFTATAVTKLYEEMADIKLIPPIQEEPTEMIYDKTNIAKLLGVLSSASLPHPSAIGAIITKLDISDDEKVKVPYDRHGHSGFDYQYKPSVVDKVKRWLEENNFPPKIEGYGKSYTVKYLQAA